MQQPRVGIGVIIINDKKVLMGKSKNAHGNGFWAFPGGHLEYGESFEQCAQRETLEETSLQVTNIRLGHVTNDVFEYENKHYVTIFILADYISGDPLVMESDKCESWQWFNWHELPEPLFLPIKNLLMNNILI